MGTNGGCLLIFEGWNAVRICQTTAHFVISDEETECQISCLIVYDHFICTQEILTHTHPHILTESAELHFSPPKSLFSPSPSLSLLIFPFPLFSLCFLSLHLRIWFVMVTERGDRKKCLLQEKNVSNVA